MLNVGFLWNPGKKKTAKGVFFQCWWAIELTIPRLARAIAAGVAGIGLGFHRVKQPGAADQLLRALLEHLKAKHVNGDIPLAEVRHDTLGAGVQPGRDDDDLVTLVERFFIQRQAEVGLKVRRQVAPAVKLATDHNTAFGEADLLTHLFVHVPTRLLNSWGDVFTADVPLGK